MGCQEVNLSVSQRRVRKLADPSQHRKSPKTAHNRGSPRAESVHDRSVGPPREETGRAPSAVYAPDHRVRKLADPSQHRVRSRPPCTESCRTAPAPCTEIAENRARRGVPATKNRTRRRPGPPGPPQKEEFVETPGRVYTSKAADSGECCLQMRWQRRMWSAGERCRVRLELPSHDHRG